ncbi:uncharacterized protein B0I36DRAFT_356229 [Microdochium trichocladiopsis]|uniref:Uncharacterized protein n=1 Tax=Microdochium trichocladiopsis TaxID=1682393 RepID=A0A9P8XTJ0_9PEZI|nr:uncharacterized protein B0I36DRAFT_356229 [Microdochium trichocladiopsis]KAH7012133.1 hypothetical protein B0I36DRAFT_356229 [Microdochium trichocladiopsis]
MDVDVGVEQVQYNKEEDGQALHERSTKNDGSRGLEAGLGTINYQTSADEIKRATGLSSEIHKHKIPDQHELAHNSPQRQDGPSQLSGPPSEQASAGGEASEPLTNEIIPVENHSSQFIQGAEDGDELGNKRNAVMTEHEASPTNSTHGSLNPVSEPIYDGTDDVSDDDSTTGKNSGIADQMGSTRHAGDEYSSAVRDQEEAFGATQASAPFKFEGLRTRGDNTASVQGRTSRKKIYNDTRAGRNTRRLRTRGGGSGEIADPQRKHKDASHLQSTQMELDEGVEKVQDLQTEQVQIVPEESRNNDRLRGLETGLVTISNQSLTETTMRATRLSLEMDNHKRSDQQDVILNSPQRQDHTSKLAEPQSEQPSVHREAIEPLIKGKILVDNLSPQPIQGAKDGDELEYAEPIDAEDEAFPTNSTDGAVISASKPMFEPSDNDSTMGGENSDTPDSMVDLDIDWQRPSSEAAIITDEGQPSTEERSVPQNKIMSQELGCRPDPTMADSNETGSELGERTIQPLAPDEHNEQCQPQTSYYKVQSSELPTPPEANRASGMVVVLFQNETIQSAQSDFDVLDPPQTESGLAGVPASRSTKPSNQETPDNRPASPLEEDEGMHSGEDIPNPPVSQNNDTGEPGELSHEPMQGLQTGTDRRIEMEHEGCTYDEVECGQKGRASSSRFTSRKATVSKARKDVARVTGARVTRSQAVQKRTTHLANAVQRVLSQHTQRSQDSRGGDSSTPVPEMRAGIDPTMDDSDMEVLDGTEASERHQEMALVMRTSTGGSIERPPNEVSSGSGREVRIIASPMKTAGHTSEIASPSLDTAHSMGVYERPISPFKELSSATQDDCGIFAVNETMVTQEGGWLSTTPPAHLQGHILAERDAGIADHTAQLELAVRNMSDELVEKNRELADKDWALAEKDRAVAEKGKALEEKNRALDIERHRADSLSDTQNKLQQMLSQLHEKAENARQCEQMATDKASCLETQLKQLQEHAQRDLDVMRSKLESDMKETLDSRETKHKEDLGNIEADWKGKLCETSFYNIQAALLATEIITKLISDVRRLEKEKSEARKRSDTRITELKREHSDAQAKLVHNIGLEVKRLYPYIKSKLDTSQEICKILKEESSRHRNMLREIAGNSLDKVELHARDGDELVARVMVSLRNMQDSVRAATEATAHGRLEEHVREITRLTNNEQKLLDEVEKLRREQASTSKLESQYQAKLEELDNDRQQLLLERNNAKSSLDTIFDQLDIDLSCRDSTGEEDAAALVASRVNEIQHQCAVSIQGELGTVESSLDDIIARHKPVSSTIEIANEDRTPRDRLANRVIQIGTICDELKLSKEILAEECKGLTEASKSVQRDEVSQAAQEGRKEVLHNIQQQVSKHAAHAICAGRFDNEEEIIQHLIKTDHNLQEEIWHVDEFLDNVLTGAGVEQYIVRDIATLGTRKMYDRLCQSNKEHDTIKRPQNTKEIYELSPTNNEQHCKDVRLAPIESEAESTSMHQSEEVARSREPSCEINVASNEHDQEPEDTCILSWAGACNEEESIDSKDLAGDNTRAEAILADVGTLKANFNIREAGKADVETIMAIELSTEEIRDLRSAVCKWLSEWLSEWNV